MGKGKKKDSCLISSPDLLATLSNRREDVGEVSSLEVEGCVREFAMRTKDQNLITGDSKNLIVRFDVTP
jgi:hypothetical protein